MIKKCVCALVVLVAFNVVAADTPFGVWRFGIAYSEPTADTSVLFDFGGMILSATLEGDSSVGVTTNYEIRQNQRFGVEFGVTVTGFDFDVSAAGASVEFGEAAVAPFWVGLDVHLLGEDSAADLYLGPLAGYAVWSNFESPGLPDSDLDDDFVFGGVIGVDVPFGSGDWQFNAAVRYMTLTAEDPSAKIDVDPLMVELGFGRRF